MIERYVKEGCCFQTYIIIIIGESDYMNVKNNLTQRDDTDRRIEQIQPSDKLKAHKMGDLSLTITTIILVVISIYFNAYFAPFIILLMSSRIGTSIYTIIKTTSKKEIRKLIIWIALLVKSIFSYGEILIAMM